MREVEFRTIDRLFIKMSINDKMWVIFLLFLVALTSVAGSRYLNDLHQFEQQSIANVQAKLDGIIEANPTDIYQITGISKANHQQKACLQMVLPRFMAQPLRVSLFN